MTRRQSGQALVEWAASAFILLLFGLGILAVGQVGGEYMAIRSAASQAAFAAARAQSEDDAQTAARAACQQAIEGSQVKDFSCSVDTAGFQRGAILTATAHGYVDLSAFPIASGSLGARVPITWKAHALIEPYRSRTP